MRKPFDRIRHALSFEIIGILLVVPLGSLVFGFAPQAIGVVAVGSATIAMVWNYLFNWLFDRILVRATGSSQKTVAMRVAHSILFEGGLLVGLIPFISWYLQIGVIEALIMDVSFSVFFLGYAFVFNWLYDLAFPLPEWQNPDA